MNRLTLLLVASLSACGPDRPVMPEPTIPLASGTGTLEAMVTKVKTGKGRVFCALHNTPEGFPGPSPLIGGALSASPDGTSVACRFEKLPADTYAISVFQDENANGVLDTNAFGAPTEGYGASRNELPVAAAPTFEENAVNVGDGAQVAVEIALR